MPASATNPLIVAAFQRLKQHNPDYLEAIELRPTGSQWRRWKCDPKKASPNLEMLRQPTSKQWRRWCCRWERRATWEELAALPWQMLPSSERVEGVHRIECMYYRCTSGLDATATEHIKLLSEFDNFDDIYIHEGPHGVELLSHLVEETYTEEAWLILGPLSLASDSESNDLIVYTAYPGRMACTVTHHPLWDGTATCLPAIAKTNIPIAVKGVNAPAPIRLPDFLKRA